MPNLIFASTIAITLFAVLAAVDGLYFHLWKYKLHRWRETRREHWLHTARALLFPAVLALLWIWNTAGVALWAAVGLVALDLAIQLADVLVEGDSRRRFGGLSSVEYALHVTLTGLHVAALVLALAAKRPDAWALSSPLILDAALPAVATTVGNFLAPGSVLIALLHVWLPRALPAQGEVGPGVG